MQYVAFYDWFPSLCVLSRFICAVVCNRTPFLFIAECYSVVGIETILFINYFMDILAIVANAIMNPVHRVMCGHYF